MKKIISLFMAVVISIAFCACSKSAQNETDGNSAPIKYTYDGVYSYYDQSIIRAYESLCQAVVDGEEDVRLNLGMLENIQNLFYTSFPLSKLVKSIDKNSDNSGILISYINEKNEHLKLVGEFSSKVESIIKECEKDTAGDIAFTVRLYHYIASNMTESENPSVSCYDTIMNNQGSMFSYSSMFEYILRQKGIVSYHVMAQDAAGKDWALSSAVLNGEIYYFDIMSEFYANKGTQLIYFGMTSADVSAEGLNNVVYMNQQPAQDSSDLHFDQCRSCKAWKIKNNSLLVTRSDDETVEISL